MTQKTFCRCKECKSFNVYADAWVGCNNPNDILGPYDTFFCIDCDSECSMEEITNEDYTNN